jgi:shikimate dehydrogenase
VPLAVEPARLPDAVRGLAALGFAGANVTIPHKERVLELCDELDDVAARAGSVNTIVVRDGSLRGSSTDGLAVTGALGVGPTSVLVLGAGGAAKAVVAALAEEGHAVRVSARRGEWPPERRDATVVVNATPVKDELLVDPSGLQAVVDLAYNADGTPTRLISAARAAGCFTVDGVEVLVRQGAASFERWTDVRAPVDVMRCALAAWRGVRTVSPVA